MDDSELRLSKIAELQVITACSAVIATAARHASKATADSAPWEAGGLPVDSEAADSEAAGLEERAVVVVGGDKT